MANRMERRLSEIDPDMFAAIENEQRRQHEGLELIASENFVSEAVLEAAGRSSFKPSMSMCSHTQAPRRMPQPIPRFSNPEIPFWDSTLLMAAISRTATS